MDGRSSQALSVSTALCEIVKTMSASAENGTDATAVRSESGEPPSSSSSSAGPAVAPDGPAAGRAESSDDALRFDEAIRMALTVCEATAPHDKFRLIETPNQNFLLVTNVLPKEECFGENWRAGDGGGKGRPGTAATTSSSVSTGNNVLRELSDTVPGDRGRPSRHNRDYALRDVATITYTGHLMSSTYVVYTKAHLERALSLDKRAFIQRILKHVDTPGLLDHNNVCDAEALLWMLYCGPMSFCQSDPCLGRDKTEYGGAFPALLPPIFYEPVTDYLAYMNLAELYVHVWYRSYEFKVEADATCVEGGLGQVTLGRARDTLRMVRDRFHDREVPLWPVASRTCLFCALYNQNRLCLDFAKTNASCTSYSPIVLKDCPGIVTNVTLSHALPGTGGATLFPVYNIGVLLKALRRSESGELELRL
uniref:GP95 n=1 Tax=Caviid herpesvirus 2 str. CIDMTR TaxID=1415526 RepID=U6H6F3_9BETA|nr:GP95 [Caviid herpesvirus 2 str. CIDMTR]